jgi:anti-anti-sigma regulatory factor
MQREHSVLKRSGEKMLRISVLNEPGTIRLKLEGKLAHEWVQEAETSWAAVVKAKDGMGIVVDLLDVSFVDLAGHALLTAMRHAGAELIGAGPLMSALIEEIEKQEISISQDRIERRVDARELRGTKQ